MKRGDRRFSEGGGGNSTVAVIFSALIILIATALFAPGVFLSIAFVIAWLTGEALAA